MVPARGVPGGGGTAIRTLEASASLLGEVCVSCLCLRHYQPECPRQCRSSGYLCVGVVTLFVNLVKFFLRCFLMYALSFQRDLALLLRL